MDGTAIKELERMASLALTNEQLHARGVDAVVVYDGVGIHDLEQYREHMRVQRGTFTTHYIEAFSEYVAANHGALTPRVFIDDTGWSATAFMDFGTTEHPGHRLHKAVLKLKQTAEYAALESFVDRSQSTQKEFAEFLSDWRHCIKCYESCCDVGEPLDIKAAIISIKNMKLAHTTESNSVVGNFSNEQSGMERIDAQSRAGIVPGLFVFKATPYHGLSDVDFAVRVTIPFSPTTWKDDKPKFSFQIVRFGDIIESIADDFSARVEKELVESGDDDESRPIVTVGTFI